MSTFEECFVDAIKEAHVPPRPLENGECQTRAGRRCNLCFAVDLQYEDERRIKNTSLQKFWRQQFPTVQLSSLVCSPRERCYRTVTKRKAFASNGTVQLGLIGLTARGAQKPMDVMRCAIEPPEHAVIYDQTQQSLGKPYAEPLARELKYVIIKGSYTEFSVILNVHSISPTLVRSANTLSKSLTHVCDKITGVFLFEDDSDGSYYLGSAETRQARRFRKIFGKGEIYQTTLGRSFLYSPLSFSQVNQSIIEPMVTEARKLLDLNKTVGVFDLYCGYGLFGLCLSDRAKTVTGVDMSHASVASAIANSRRQKAENVRFVQSDITADSLPRTLKNAGQGDVVILDPPRSGTAEGVIELIAAKQPARVLHVFCEIDLISKEIERWEKSGYRVSRAIPFDMFPGTAEVEVMVLLEPDNERKRRVPPN